MKTIPSHTQMEPATGGKLPGLPSHLPLGGVGTYSTANRRISGTGADRAYPILLVLSTLVAATFCYLYITKPVRIIPTALIPQIPLRQESTPAAKSLPVAASPNLLPREANLPGDTKQPSSPATSPASPDASPASPFEETNLRIQHVLNAESPNGEISRIILNVPVLYQSRNLRWTAQDVATARELLNRLSDYQEKSVALRSEGSALLASWSRLIEKTIPARDVRADSPSLPTNQQDSADIPQSAEFNTPQSIQIQPAEK